MTQLKSRRWQELLTPEQQHTYASAIRQGFFAAYDGYRWRHTFYGAYLWKNPGRVRVMAIFRDIIGRAPMWEDVTDDNLRDLRAELAERYAPNSVRTICAELAAVIRENAASKPVPSLTYGDVLRSKKVLTQAVFLTDDEIRRIHLYTPRTLRRRHIKRIFMLECLTGARLSDCIRLTPDNIAPDGRTLTYVSQKTTAEVTVPVHPWLRDYIVPTAPNEPPCVTVSSYNESVRDICRAVGIDATVKVFQSGREQRGPKYRFVTTHTGRRSFATNLALKNVPLEQIALMMGHLSGNVPNIAMTQRYIVSRLTLSPDAFRAFQLPGAEQLAAERDALNAPAQASPDQSPATPLSPPIPPISPISPISPITPTAQ